MPNKIHSLKILPFLFLLTSLAGHGQDTLSIKKIIEEETNAWNKGDARAYSQHFAKQGTFTNVLGLYYEGYEQFLIRHDQIFKTVFKGSTMTQNIVSLRFIEPHIAILETITWISGLAAKLPFEGVNADDQGRLRTRLLQVLKKEGEEWKIESYHNVDIEKGIPSPEPH